MTIRTEQMKSDISNQPSAPIMSQLMIQHQLGFNAQAATATDQDGGRIEVWNEVCPCLSSQKNDGNVVSGQQMNQTKQHPPAIPAMSQQQPIHAHKTTRTRDPWIGSITKTTRLHRHRSSSHLRLTGHLFCTGQLFGSQVRFAGNLHRSDQQLHFHKVILITCRLLQ